MRSRISSERFLRRHDLREIIRLKNGQKPKKRDDDSDEDELDGKIFLLDVDM